MLRKFFHQLSPLQPFFQESLIALSLAQLPIKEEASDGLLVTLRMVLVYIGLNAFLALFLSGCGGPSFILAMAGLPNTNPDATGRPSPVMLQMYELRSDLMFKQAEMIPLFRDPSVTLGSDLIAYDEMTILPGKAYTVVYEPTPETKFVGVMASFRQTAGKGPWKVIVPIDPEEATTIGIELNSSSLILIPAEKLKKWDPAKAVESYRETIRAQPNSVSVTVSSSGSTSAPPANGQSAASPLSDPAQDLLPETSPSMVFDYPPISEAESITESSQTIKTLKKFDTMVNQ
ncbi:MAG: type VI secretion system lipoprotein TssJ [Deltaproteobacteria bacterium]|jgi:type VI secretion system protein VasD|nr:type VI secretion system lipoprotein TssJ [Deltaproteobacteria bacterium]